MTGGDYRVADLVPEGASGAWTVRRVTIGRMEAALATAQCPRRPTRPGTFTELRRGGALVMVDSWTEFREHLPLLERASGRVLLNGLGLGMAARLCLENPSVAHVTAVEISADVVSLVAPHLERAYPGRFSVVHADALTWRPPGGSRWNAVWHDIWPEIGPGNLPQMHLLHRRFGRRARWQGSWARDACERLAR